MSCGGHKKVTPYFNAVKTVFRLRRYYREMFVFFFFFFLFFFFFGWGEGEGWGGGKRGDVCSLVSAILLSYEEMKSINETETPISVLVCVFCFLGNVYVFN